MTSTGFRWDSQLSDLDIAQKYMLFLQCSPLGDTFDVHEQLIADKTKYALDKGLGVILCIGEALEDREAGKTFLVNTLLVSQTH